MQVPGDQQLEEVVEKSSDAVFYQAFFLDDVLQIRLGHLSVVHQHHAVLRHEIAAAKARAVPAAARQCERSAQTVGAHLCLADVRVPRARRMVQHRFESRQRRFVRQLVRIQQHHRRAALRRAVQWRQRLADRIPFHTRSPNALLSLPHCSRI